MMVERSPWQVRELDAPGRDRELFSVIGKLHDRVRVRDIQRIAHEGHTERRIQIVNENRSCFGDAVTIGVAKHGDPVGARHCRAGPFEGALHVPPANSLGHVLGPGRCICLGYKHVAIRQNKQRARMFEACGERRYFQIACGRWRAAPSPPDRRRYGSRRPG